MKSVLKWIAALLGLGVVVAIAVIVQVVFFRPFSAGITRFHSVPFDPEVI